MKRRKRRLSGALALVLGLSLLPGGALAAGTSLYSVKVDPELSNGRVTTDKARAARNETVVITATPDAGYQTRQVTVTPALGLRLDVSRPDTAGGSSYSFSMPEQDVTVSALFAGAPVYGDVSGDGDVTMADVVKLSRSVAGFVTLTGQEKKLGDVTGDGDVTMADVVKVSRFVAGFVKDLTPPVQSYTVTFHNSLPTGGSSTYTAQVEQGRPVTRPADPVCAGYVFLGWYTQPSGGSRYAFASPVTGPLSLYSQWSKVGEDDGGFGALN